MREIIYYDKRKQHSSNAKYQMDKINILSKLNSTEEYEKYYYLKNRSEYIEEQDIEENYF